MVIVIWFVSIVVSSIVLGEIIFCVNRKNQKKINYDDWNSKINSDLEMLDIENPMIDLVSQFTLRKRGSWRMAQDRVIGKNIFLQQRDMEYKKML